MDSGEAPVQFWKAASMPDLIDLRQADPCANRHSIRECRTGQLLFNPHWLEWTVVPQAFMMRARVAKSFARLQSDRTPMGRSWVYSRADDPQRVPESLKAVLIE